MKQKVISAIALLLIAIPICLLGGIYFAAGIGLIAFLSYKEILDLTEDKKIPEIIKVIGFICLIYLIYQNYDSGSLVAYIEYWGLGILMIVLLIPVVLINDKNKYSTRRAFYLIGNIIFLGIAFNTLLQIRNYDLKYLIYILLITILTDTFAQIIGLLIGKHKLSTISPKKSWEGSIAGSTLSTFVASSYYLSYINPNVFILKIIVLTFLLTIVCQFGDLVFSAIKRLNNKKDFSNIIPGHGGILDRIDSIIMSALAFALMATFI